jgi:hypothetical protein
MPALPNPQAPLPSREAIELANALTLVLTTAQLLKRSHAQGTDLRLERRLAVIETQTRKIAEVLERMAHPSRS